MLITIPDWIVIVFIIIFSLYTINNSLIIYQSYLISKLKRKNKRAEQEKAR